MMVSYRDIKAYAERMVRLTSRESLASSTVIAVGTGSLEKSASQAQLRAWRSYSAAPQVSTDHDLMAFSSTLKRAH